MGDKKIQKNAPLTPLKWQTLASKKVSFQRGFARYLLAISSVCAASRNFYDLRLSRVLAQRV